MQFVRHAMLDITQQVAVSLLVQCVEQGQPHQQMHNNVHAMQDITAQVALSFHVLLVELVHIH